MRNALEGQLQSELQLPRRTHSAINPSSCGVERAGRVADRTGGNAEIHAVKQIERFKPELQFGLFGHVEVLQVIFCLTDPFPPKNTVARPPGLRLARRFT